MRIDSRDRAEADRIRRNQARCITTEQMAECLFDLSRELRSEALQTLAIEISGMAQDGIEITREQAEAIRDRAVEVG